MTRVLGIETSCDETAAAVVDDGAVIRASVVSSQIDIHARFGGVVPELASRAHVELIGGVVAAALAEADTDLMGVDAIAAVHGPGLAGALIVGVSAAKALALVSGRPYVGVHHHEAHLYAARLEDPTLRPPLVTLVFSGGHTMIVAVGADGAYRLMGRTVDDAAGEAFDKVARLLGLGYPGGPAIERVAAEGDPAAVAFPRPMLHDGDDFSFSGLKTAVVLHRRDHPEVPVADVAASFQAAVVEVCTVKLLRAARAAGAGTVVLGGGVAANTALRSAVAAGAEAAGLRVVLPARALCTNNAAMVAAAGAFRLAADGPTALDDGVAPGLRLPDRSAGW
ncbi:MAG: tRNA (adenosine(37)-N6)-threonylcarbamoyltransferase complex transferase subunit TsaD [Actinomycetota bacterium]